MKFPCTTRPLVAADRPAFKAFVRSNRWAFEHFNEPHPPAWYSDAGLDQAFEGLLASQQAGSVLTRVAPAAGQTGWSGWASLSVQRSGLQTTGLLVYQTDHLHLRRGVASALVDDLIGQACALEVARVNACVAIDNLVSLHLLRRAGLQAAGWDPPARLQRGAVACLRLSRGLVACDGLLARPHMQLAA